MRMPVSMCEYTHARMRACMHACTCTQVQKRKQEVAKALQEGRKVVQDIQERANLSEAEVRAQKQRTSEASALMSEFLAARKEERGREQTMRRGERAAAVAAGHATEAGDEHVMVGGAVPGLGVADLVPDLTAGELESVASSASQLSASIMAAVRGSSVAGVGWEGTEAVEESRSSMAVQQGKALSPEEQARHRLPRAADHQSTQNGAGSAAGLTGPGAGGPGGGLVSGPGGSAGGVGGAPGAGAGATGNGLQRNGAATPAPTPTPTPGDSLRGSGAKDSPNAAAFVAKGRDDSCVDTRDLYS